MAQARVAFEPHEKQDGEEKKDNSDVSDEGTASESGDGLYGQDDNPKTPRMHKREKNRSAGVRKKKRIESEDVNSENEKDKAKRKVKKIINPKRRRTREDDMFSVSKQLMARNMGFKSFKTLATREASIDDHEGGSSSGRATPTLNNMSTSLLTEKSFDFHNRDNYHRQLRSEILTDYRNQKSDDQKVYGMQMHQTHSRDKKVIVRMGSSNENHRLEDVLWLALQAFWLGLPLDKEAFNDSLREADETIDRKRKIEKTVLPDIRNFTSTSSLQSCSILDSLLIIIDRLSVSEESKAHNLGLDTKYLEETKNTMEQVGKLLNRLENYQDLFPNWTNLKNMSEVGIEPGLNFNDTVPPDADRVYARIKVLYVWYNIANDLHNKINQVGKMLRADKRIVGWPFLETDDSKKEREESDSAPINDDLNRSVSDQEMQCPDLYMDYVESSFRSGGMGEVMKTLLNILLRTLHKGRKALEVARRVRRHATPVRRSLVHSSELVSPDSLPTPQLTVTNTMNVTTSTPESSINQTSNSSSQHTPSVQSGPTSTQGHNTVPIVKINSFDRKKIISMSQIDKESDPELSYYGVNHEEFEKMRLPTLAPAFLFLLRVPLNLVHEWLQLRVKQKLDDSDHKPDALLLRTLIKDCHDCLVAAVDVKCFYQEYAQSVTTDDFELEKLLVDEMAGFEQNLQEMFALYLDYVLSWASHQYTDESAEGVQNLFEELDAEWKFAKKTAINVLSGESTAAKMFCTLCNQLSEEMIRKYMQDRCDGINDDVDDEEEDDECADEIEEKEEGQQSGDDITDMYNSPRGHHDNKPSAVLERCRKFKRIICGVRERSLRLLTFCKMLRTDLEITARFDRNEKEEGTLDHLLELLKEEKFVLVTTSQEHDFLMFTEESTSQCEEHLQLLLNVTCGRDESEVPQGLTNKPGYLLLVGIESNHFGQCKKDWLKNGGKEIKVTPDADTEQCLRYTEVYKTAVYLVVVNSSSLSAQRRALSKKIGSQYLELTDEQLSCHDIIYGDMNELKDTGLHNRKLIAEQIKSMTSNDLLVEKKFEELDKQEESTYRDCIIQAYNFAFEYHRELAKIISSHKRRLAMGEGFLDFVKQWSSFVQRTIGPGNGRRPRWAFEGFNFLILSSQPAWTSGLTNEQYQELCEEIDKCSSHLIGEPRISDETTPEGRFNNGRTKSVGNLGHFNTLNHSSVSTESGNSSRSSYRSRHLRADTLDIDLPASRKCSDGHNDNPHTRILSMLKDLDQHRDHLLRNGKTIGGVVENSDKHYSQRLEARARVPFRWQRLDQKIGEGRFGKVYKALNLEKKTLMALKELKLDKSNHSEIKQFVDEIHNVMELTPHPNLVRYYGVETHRTEVYLFMEYCNEGSLDTACREGLPTYLIRQYTFRLLDGVSYLHTMNIIHRDIKPQNIFLTSKKSQLKLGDFGSSIKLNGASTMMGELREYHGTVGYMAPEVITSERNCGYGRAADVWSVGATLVHMITGKPPYYPTAEMTILFTVGSNSTPPPVNKEISTDARAFLDSCFRSNAGERPRAGELIEMPFAKVFSRSSAGDVLSQQSM